MVTSLYRYSCGTESTTRTSRTSDTTKSTMSIKENTFSVYIRMVQSPLERQHSCHSCRGGRESWKKTRIGVASAVFNLPFMRDFYLWFGAVDATREALNLQLNKGNSVALLPGGIKEQLLVCSPKRETIVLNKRKGFIRLALQHGASLVPVFIFGERDAYKTSRVLSGVSWFLKRLFNAGIPMVRGRFFSMVAYPVPLHLVMGKPIDTPKLTVVPDVHGQQRPNERATEVTQSEFDSYVDHYHQVYVDELQTLFDQHKEAAGYHDTHLKIL
eukprot:gb/GECG01005674.1/.p1 GENE.gb/GECG01005674.1/~~gb/GECG01005674.1/.p1  ORF type:complete len:271 (+),score=19.07 gb/GECG01005674.1/:1-813(+)